MGTEMDAGRKAGHESHAYNILIMLSLEEDSS